MPIDSFHHCLRACLAGEDSGWRELIRAFLPLSEHLAGQYFSDVWPAKRDLGVTLFSRLRANHSERLRSYSGSAEKEFLVFLRDQLFLLGRGQRGERVGQAMTSEQLAELLNDFLLVPRGAVLMAAKGYAPERFANLLHMEEGTARDILQKANARLETMGLAVRLPLSDPATLDRRLEQVERQEATSDCVPVRVFVRLLDGQITWGEKEPAETHLAGCSRCFLNFTTYQEVQWFYVDSPAAEAARVEQVAMALGLAGAGPQKKRSFFSRRSR